MDRVSDAAVFCTVVNQGSFTAAADALQCSKGAVSKFVSRLEARLGVRLLNRTTRRLSLTEAGEDFYRRASRALAELGAAEQEVAEHADRPSGTLRISAPTFYGAEILSCRLADFHRRFPQLSIDLVLDNRLVDLVEERFDAAIRIAAPVDSTLVMRRLMDVPMVTCASPAYLKQRGRPAHPGELGDHECLIYTLDSRPDQWSYVRLNGAPYTVQVRGKLRVNDDHVLRRAAMDGIGIARMPRPFLQDALDGGELVALWPDDHETNLTLAIVYPSRHELPAKMRAFIAFMVT